MQTATSHIIDAPVHQRRAHKRYDYAAPCSIHKDNAVFVASVNNISEGGINVKLEQLGVSKPGKLSRSKSAHSNQSTP